MTARTPQSSVTDHARNLVTANFAAMLESGHFQLRIRLPKTEHEAWFYGHKDNEWHKLLAEKCDNNILAAIQEELAALASKPHTKGLDVRQREKSDWADTDIRFDTQVTTDHQGKNLAAYIYGLLFYDHHDSAQDMRRRIQRGARFDH